jgi:dienelactone hydrolase
MHQVTYAHRVVSLTAALYGLFVGAAVCSAAAVDAPPGITARDATIVGDGVTLAGTLYLPSKTKRPIPGVVIVHGSGPTTRAMTTFWTNSALRVGGLAVLVYDKRGTGQSSGTYPPWEVATTASMFSDFASDAEHAIRWLAQQPDIDPTRLGLVGGSQAGWIMPLAASREPLIRFLFIGEGVPLAAGIEDIHSHYLDAVTSDGEVRPTLRQIAAADLLAEDYVGERGYDPTPVLTSLDIPVMWTFGLYDEAIPTRLSIHRIGELRKQGRTNFNIHLFPFADHNFYDVFSGERYDVSAVMRAWMSGLELIHPARARP